jgi:hypothetical protein
MNSKSNNRTGGPRTPEGKANSCLNNLRHGLAGAFRVLDSESQEEFDAFLASLRDDHQPETPTEELLLSRVAEHSWLSRRAQRLQDAAILEGSNANFALMLRYQTTNDRGFHKCMDELRKLKKERLKNRKEEFESHAELPPFMIYRNDDPETDKIHDSAMVAELRRWMGRDYSASDADILKAIKGCIHDYAVKLTKEAEKKAA